MDLPAPTLPPYGKIDAVSAQCIAVSAAKFQVPETLLHALLSKENGVKGQCIKRSNNSYDCGLGQVNSIWFGDFNKYGITPQAIAHNNCVNIEASTYILKSYIVETKDTFKGIIAYNIGPNKWAEKPARFKLGYDYALDVVRRWWQFEAWKAQLQGKSNTASGTKLSVNQGADLINKKMLSFSP